MKPATAIVIEAEASERRKGRAGGYVYFLLAVGANRVKIGYSKTVSRRLATLKASSPFPLKVVAIIPVLHASDEKKFHERFARHRVHGEWFNFCPEMQEFTEEAPVPREFSEPANIPGIVTPKSLRRDVMKALMGFLRRKNSDDFNKGVVEIACLLEGLTRSGVVFTATRGQYQRYMQNKEQGDARGN